ncbi:MAG: hypothetical protein HQK53_00020 [Oligoflexia bacterium]|nr:hypothetical protein [Oligoflexia bacterium]
MKKPQESPSRRQCLLAQFQLIELIRNFFKARNFTDVMTPPMVENPGYEAHIHAFRIYSDVNKQMTPLYLHTSPEFHMKELLSLGFDKIFNISYCFRDEPSSIIHRNQFLMLEWYRTQQRYEKIMEDTEELIAFCASALSSKQFTYERYTVQELFQEYLGINILDFLDTTDLCMLIQKNFPEVPLPQTQLPYWDDYYFLLFLNKIEPKLQSRSCLLLYEFPYHLNALSTIKQSDPRVCERFEVYLYGIELCNCFNELTDLETQKQRFLEQSIIKEKLYGNRLPPPRILFDALERGLPPSAGVALGIERLLLALTNIENPFYI